MKHTAAHIAAAALLVWIMISLWAGYFEAQPGLFSSSADAKDYIAGASYRLPTYYWLYRLFGTTGLVILQAAAYVAAVVLLYAATGRAVLAAALAGNLTLVSLTHHGLTEPLAVLAVCAALYAVSRRAWWGLSLALAVLFTLRPILPLPLESYEQMATINRLRFVAQVNGCQHVFGQLGAYIYVVRTNIVNNIFAFSNFGPAWVKVYMLLYNSALWLAWIFYLRQLNKRTTFYILILIAMAAITSAQGDRIMLIAVPVVLYSLKDAK